MHDSVGPPSPLEPSPSPSLCRDLAIALTLLTRIPIVLPGVVTARAIGRAYWAFPLIGLGVGLIGGGIYWLLSVLGVPALAAAALAVMLVVLVTGGLHEDGLADSADGFGGGRNREQILGIMRDSRIGGYGGLALILIQIVRLASLAAFPGFMGFMGFMAAQAASRGMMVGLASWLPPARKAGADRGIASAAAGARLAGMVGLSLGVAVLLASGWIIGGFIGMIAALGAAGIGSLVTFGFGLMVLRRIGGQTGDILGATQQLSEAAMLVALAVLWARFF